MPIKLGIMWNLKEDKQERRDCFTLSLVHIETFWTAGKSRHCFGPWEHFSDLNVTLQFKKQKEISEITETGRMDLCSLTF